MSKLGCPHCGEADQIVGVETRDYDGVAYWVCTRLGCGAFPREDLPGSARFARLWRRRCERLGTDPTVIPQREVIP